jgi:heme exporter protein D
MKLISNFDVLILGGYGHFIWPAFIFTIFSFVYLYITSRKELKLLEEEYKQTSDYKVKINNNPPEPKKISKEILVGNSAL